MPKTDASLMPANHAWDIASLDAHGQAALVANGEAAPGDLVEAAISRIAAINPSLNAVSHCSFSYARRAISQIDATAPMAFVPNLLKASFPYPPFPMTCGSRARRHSVSSVAYPLARRFDEAGFAPVGMSTMPEFGLMGSGEALLFGPTRNPWNLDRSPGGSSSGAAAAVAAGLTPVAHGSDGGGSIRIPASNCGVIGFKASRGWNVRARGPNLADDLLCSDGLITRTVRDAVWAARYFRPNHLADTPSARDKRLRIAVDLNGMNGQPADRDVCEAILKSAELSRSAGHNVEEMESPIDKPAVRDAFGVLWSYGGGDILDHYASQGSDPNDILEPWTIGLANRRASISPERLARAFHHITDATQRLAEHHEAYDVILSPVTRSAPPLIGALAPTVPFEELWDRHFDYVDYTPLQNMTGAPSMSLPLFMTDSGLPVGSMFTAKPGDDEILLSLAQELEAAHPWSQAWPLCARPAQ